jgi:hypothetical protein
MNTALVYGTRMVHEGGRQCKKSTLNDLVHLTPLRIPLMNPPCTPDPSKNTFNEPANYVRNTEAEGCRELTYHGVLPCLAGR